jgi:hypothetical protein
MDIRRKSRPSVGFDGETLRPVRFATLARQLTGLRRANIRLQLFNAELRPIQPVVQEYHLRIMAPDEESLAEVDRLFLCTLDVDDVNLDKVGTFYEATCDESAAEYAEALADYVRAVLIKDRDPRTGVSGRLSHYHEIQNRALNILQSFDRPLANLLPAIIRFGLNDFSRWQEHTGLDSLDYAYSILGPLAQNDHTTGVRRSFPFQIVLFWALIRGKSKSVQCEVIFVLLGASDFRRFIPFGRCLLILNAQTRKLTGYF